jgi:hypothetical protein
MIDPENIRLLQHAIGIKRNKPMPAEPWRNRFCAGVGSDDGVRFEAMVDAGLAVRGVTLNDGTSRMYAASRSGILAAQSAEQERRDTERLRLWSVTCTDGRDAHTETVLARTAGAAKYLVALDWSDTGPSVGECFKRMRVRLAA